MNFSKMYNHFFDVRFLSIYMMVIFAKKGYDLIFIFFDNL